MKKNTDPLEPGTFYHIYNRGINGTSIFFEHKNYKFFLEKYAKHITHVADTYAYCLLKNHFHFLIKTKSEEDIMTLNVDGVYNPLNNVAGLLRLQARLIWL